MLIDWFTVGAQALNFLILVWLMKRFLYKPILQAIDAREKRIAMELADADTKKAEALKDRDEFQHKNEEFDQQRAALMSKATGEATVQRQRLLDEARKDVDELRAKRQDALRNEQRNLSQEITRWTQKEVFAITRKTLADLANTSLEERMSEMFIHRLRALIGTAKEQLATALTTSTQPARVRSAFDLPSTQHAAIQKAINETFSADIHIQFETVPELVSGIELSSNGQKVAWSIAEYLATLEKSVGELLHEDTKPVSKPDANSKPDTKVVPKPEPMTGVKSELRIAAKPEPNRASQHELESGSSAPKVDH
ncbi:MAG TPA: F0F1 ATP synthase subunit delta [Gemmata sp.]|jgi:F-type H+-transporting ATPase subunit b|nr:F0F1 ATP synthase subunit delta [Gemmata sp.]